MISITMTGNLADDAKITESASGKFITFRIADTRRWKGAGNVEHENTQWASCIMRGDREAILPYLRKGQKVLIQGEPNIDVYSSPKFKLWVGRYNVHVQHIELCGGGDARLPRELFTQDGVAIPLNQCAYIDAVEYKNLLETVLLDSKANQWQVDPNGYVFMIAPEPEAD